MMQLDLNHELYGEVCWCITEAVRHLKVYRSDVFLMGMEIILA